MIDSSFFFSVEPSASSRGPLVQKSGSSGRGHAARQRVSGHGVVTCAETVWSMDPALQLRKHMAIVGQSADMRIKRCYCFAPPGSDTTSILGTGAVRHTLLVLARVWNCSNSSLRESPAPQHHVHTTRLHRPTGPRDHWITRRPDRQTTTTPPLPQSIAAAEQQTKRFHRSMGNRGRSTNPVSH